MIIFWIKIIILATTFISVLTICRIRKEIVLDCSNLNITRRNISNLLNESNLLDIIELDLSNNKINKISALYFNGFNNVEVIRLTGNYINDIDDRAFANLPKLRQLYLDQNNIEKIPSKSLQSISRLTMLNLDNNKIKILKDNLFRNAIRLQNLTLNFNKIEEISPNAFSGLSTKLCFLYLRGNKLKTIPTNAIKHLYKLTHVDFTGNQIVKLSKDSFIGMRSLREVKLFDDIQFGEKIVNRELDIHVHPGAFRFMKALRKLKLHSPLIKINSFPDLEGTDNLRMLSVRGINNLIIPSDFCRKKLLLKSIFVGLCKMKNFPSLNKCKRLAVIDFIENNIQYIPADAFSGLTLIENIEILQRDNRIGSIHEDAFSHLPILTELDLSHFTLKKFPNLNGTNNLKILNLQFCNLTSMPSHFCSNLQSLTHLDLSMNKIRYLPSLAKCVRLEVIDLFQNRIAELSKQFHNLNELYHLNLADNHIKEIGENVFVSTSELNTLSISQNMLTEIHKNAFKSLSNIQSLDISFNYDLKHLPSEHLQSIVEINAKGNKRLLHFPTQEDLPHASRLTLVYPYHCCFFMKKFQQVQHEVSAQALSENSKYKMLDHLGTMHIPSLNMTMTEDVVEIKDIEPWIRWLNNDTELYFNDPLKRVRVNNFDFKDAFCIPTPNAFYPCDDLMGKQWLRVCVWIVFLFAFFGNIAVLFVLAVNLTKLDVPRYLIINLAFADLCLSIYLGFLSFVDILTIGDFRSHALDWQFSGSCKAAGFLAVFAAELSVYTLAAVTIERFTTIKNSMHVERRMSTKQATFVMLIGWIFSLTLAALPLFPINGVKLSDYTKYSVCLPFDIEATSSKVYVTLLLLFNMTAFLVILVCYIQIYCFIRGSNAWNSGDSRVARRMAILVFTDFLCWFPISVIALSAVFESSILKDLWMSKVLTVFVFPLNACANPFLYAILTKQFRKDVSSLLRHLKDKSKQSRDIRKSLSRMPLKGSLTYSTSVRRGSSCSFLFARRCSSKAAEDIKFNTRQANLQQQVDDEQSGTSCQERLTSV